MKDIPFLLDHMMTLQMTKLYFHYRVKGIPRVNELQGDWKYTSKRVLQSQKSKRYRALWVTVEAGPNVVDGLVGNICQHEDSLHHVFDVLAKGSDPIERFYELGRHHAFRSNQLVVCNQLIVNFTQKQFLIPHRTPYPIVANVKSCPKFFIV